MSAEHNRCTAPQYIYGLCHPISGLVRYVGRTSDPSRRLALHKTSRGPVRDWIESLPEPPRVVILETVPVGGSSHTRERVWLKRFGPRLLLNKRGFTCGRGSFVDCCATRNAHA